MTKELKRFEQWWDAEDDIPNNGPYTPDTPIQFAWAGWQAALAQPEQELVAIEHCLWARNGNTRCPHITPPQRKPLTDEEIDRMYVSCKYGSVRELARAIEAAHGIKENT